MNTILGKLHVVGLFTLRFEASARWIPFRQHCGANVDELDFAALCGNSADWAGVVVRKSLDKLDEGCILQLCGNPALWAGELVKTKLGIASDSKPDVPQQVALCGNPGDWAGEIVAAIRKPSRGGLLTAECVEALCELGQGGHIRNGKPVDYNVSVCGCSVWEPRSLGAHDCASR